MKVKKIFAVLLIAIFGLLAVSNSCSLDAGGYETVPGVGVTLPI